LLHSTDVDDGRREAKRYPVAGVARPASVSSGVSICSFCWLFACQRLPIRWIDQRTAGGLIVRAWSQQDMLTIFYPPWIDPVKDALPPRGWISCILPVKPVQLPRDHAAVWPRNQSALPKSPSGYSGTGWCIDEFLLCTRKRRGR